MNNDEASHEILKLASVPRSIELNPHDSSALSNKNWKTTGEVLKHSSPLMFFIRIYSRCLSSLATSPGITGGDLSHRQKHFRTRRELARRRKLTLQLAKQEEEILGGFPVTQLHF